MNTGTTTGLSIMAGANFFLTTITILTNIYAVLCKRRPVPIFSNHRIDCSKAKGIELPKDPNGGTAYTIDLHHDYHVIRGAKGPYLPPGLIPRDVLIFDGSFAEEGELPFAARLVVKYQSYILCGGTILTKNYIVTAAHCLIKYNDEYSVKEPSSIHVRVGSIMANSGGQFVYAKMAKVHINFVPLSEPCTNGYDIGLLEMENPLTLNDKVKPALPGSLPNPVSGTVLKAAGWGRTEGGIVSDRLKWASMTVTTKCRKNLPNMPPGDTSIICALRQSGHVCNGDSGGFLGSFSGNNWQLDGITSLGPCDPRGVSGFTSVGFFRDWIFENSEDNKLVFEFANLYQQQNKT